MSTPLDKLSIAGFKSIQELQDFELRNLNILIGANGSGKSNFIDFFRLLREFIDGNLLRYVKNNGGMSDILFGGRKLTPKMNFRVLFGSHGYRFTLEPDAKEGCFVRAEARYYRGNSRWWDFGDNVKGIAVLTKEATNPRDSNYTYSLPVYNAISSWVVYHFHDSSANSPMRHAEIVQDNKTLRYDASNIAPYLLDSVVTRLKPIKRCT